MFLNIYRLIINFNINPTEEEILFIKIYEEKKNFKIKKSFYMCQICNGNLLVHNHMKRSHLNKRTF